MDDQLERLIDRFSRAVCAYHAESHRDFEDTQSRALEMADARVALRSYLSEDTRRLDWLEGLGVQSVYLNEHPHQLNPASQSLRASIDNAINGRPQ